MTLGKPVSRTHVCGVHMLHVSLASTGHPEGLLKQWCYGEGEDSKNPVKRVTMV